MPIRAAGAPCPSRINQPLPCNRGYPASLQSDHGRDSSLRLWLQHCLYTASFETGEAGPVGARRGVRVQRDFSRARHSGSPNNVSHHEGRSSPNRRQRLLGDQEKCWAEDVPSLCFLFFACKSLISRILASRFVSTERFDHSAAGSVA